MEQKDETVTELFDQLNSLRVQDDCYYGFKRICDKIENLIRKRHDDETDPGEKTTYLQAFAALSHTIGKEVWFIKTHEDRMHKKNAAKVRRKEHREAIEKVYSRVYSDILMVLIDEKNRNS